MNFFSVFRAYYFLFLNPVITPTMPPSIIVTEVMGKAPNNPKVSKFLTVINNSNNADAKTPIIEPNSIPKYKFFIGCLTLFFAYLALKPIIKTTNAITANGVNNNPAKQIIAIISNMFSNFIRLLVHYSCLNIFLLRQ